MRLSFSGVPNSLAAWLAAGALSWSAPAVAQDAEVPGDTVAGLPDYYVVQAGDTLWEISSKFLGNASYWPRLWSINDYITNPHWIYPGNRIVFRMGTLIEPPQVELDTPMARTGYNKENVTYVAADAECGPDVRFNTDRPAASYLAPGFLADKGEFEVWGTVNKARTMQTYLAERDLIYLRVDDPDAFSCGDMVTVFRRVQKKVRHPDRKREKMGSVYRIVAEAKITHRYEGYLTAVVRQSWSEIERGDLVGPPAHVSVVVDLKAPRGELDGTIVAKVTQESQLIGDTEAVFIDRGSADGVRVGNSFYVVERSDENLDTKKEDMALPASVVGRVVVVRVDEYTSTAVVTDASKTLRIGNHLAMRLE